MSTIDGVSCLAMPYVYTPTVLSADWDKTVSLDLSAYTHLRFQVNGSGTGSNFRFLYIYFFAANGGKWRYITAISNQWQTITIPFADFVQEGGTYPGWTDIRHIRMWSTGIGAETGSFALNDMRAKVNTSTNQLLNGGFELTNTENLPDCWGIGLWSLSYEPIVLNTSDWRSHWAVDRTVRHSGTNSLRIDFSGDHTQRQAYSMWMKMNTGHTYMFSAWVMSNQPSLPVTLQVSGGAPSAGGSGDTTSSSPYTWKRVTLAVPSQTANSYRVCCDIYSSGTGTLWIDDVQFEAGSVASSFRPSPLDETINAQTVHRTPADTGDYFYVPDTAPNATSIVNRRFLVDSQPFIPIALSWSCNPTSRPSLAILQEIACAGFNSIVLGVGKDTSSSSLTDILNDARTCGLKVIFWSSGVLGTTTTDGTLLGWVHNLKNHPAIIAWYVYDEPSNCTNSPCTDPNHPFESVSWQDATTKVNAVRGEDTSHNRPVFINAQYNQLTNAWAGDILSTDYYPVPVYRPGSIVLYADALERLAAAPGKLVWMWQQNTGYANSESREPTGPETECMAYLSMIHGMRGFMYFECKSHSAELWTELRLLTSELRTLMPVLYSIDTPTLTASANSPIHVLSKRYGGHDYVIAVNESPHPVAATLTISGANQMFEVLFENSRAVQMSGGTLNDTFAGYQRHVYRSY